MINSLFKSFELGHLAVFLNCPQFNTCLTDASKSCIFYIYSTSE